MFMFANSDGAVVRQVLRGDRERFGVLVRRYQPVVFGVALSRVGNWADAEDVVQDVFLKSFERLGSLRDARSLGAWLVTITKNLCHDLMEKRRREAPLDHHEIAATAPCIERREAHDLLWKHILQLEEEQRELLLLHYFAGRSIKQIAALLGISVEAARKRMQRARQVLGQGLVECLGKELKAKEQADVRRVMAALPIFSKAATGGIANSVMTGGGAWAVKAIAAVVAVGVVAGTIGTVLPILRQQRGSGADTRATSTPPSPLAVEALSTKVSRQREVLDAERPKQPASPGKLGLTGAASASLAAAGSPVVSGAGQPEQGTIEGRVVDATTGEGVFGITVMAVPSTGLTGVTDQAGRFLIENVPPGKYSFGIGRRSVPSKEVEVAEGQIVQGVELPLREVGVLRGTVTDTAANPLAKATIKAEAVKAGSYISADPETPVVSDANGQFVLCGLPLDEAIQVYAESSAMRSKPQEVSVVRGTEHEMTLMLAEPRTAGITGVAMQGNKPMANGDVALYGIDYLALREFASTDAMGRFVIKALTAGKYALQAHPRTEMESTQTEHARVELKAHEQLANVQLVFPVGGVLSISGRVMTADGVPLAEVMVRANGASTEQQATTDEAGTYVIEGLGNEEYYLNFERQGYTAPRVKPVKAGSKSVDVILSASLSLAGVVVDKQTGAPIAGAAVTRVPVHMLTESNSNPRRHGAQSNTEGRFELKDVPEEAGGVLVVATGYSPAALELPTLAEGIAPPDARIELEVSPRLEVRVATAAGEPVSDAGVFIGGPVASLDHPVAISNSSGVAMLDTLVPGKVELTVSAKQYANERVVVEVKRGILDTANVVLSEGAVIRGIVRIDGVSTGPATVLTKPVGQESLASRSVEAGPDGAFELRGVTPGLVQVTVRLPDPMGTRGRRIQRQVKIADEELLVLDFEVNTGSAAVEGQVTINGETSKASIMVRVEGPSGLLELSTSSDAGGYYRIEGLPTGTATVSLGSPARIRDQKAVELIADAVARQDFDLETGAIEFAVQDAPAEHEIYVMLLRGALSEGALTPLDFEEARERCVSIVRTPRGGLKRWPFNGIPLGHFTLAAIAAREWTAAGFAEAEVVQVPVEVTADAFDDEVVLAF